MKWIFALCLLPGVPTVHAQVARMDQPMTVSATATFDASTHFYEYAYTVANPATNAANASLLVVKLQPGVDVVTEVRSPPGWTALHLEEKGTVSWAATEVVVPVGYVDDGNVLEGRATIKPGQSLGGFSFKSFSPPGPGPAITQTFAPLYVLQGDEDYEALETSPEFSRLPDDNGFRTTTTVPQPDLDDQGNRRPSADGFLVFANLDDNASYAGPSALIVMRLAAGNETVYPQTLSVSVNQRDVTSLFAWNPLYKGYAAELTPENAGLVPGRNILIAAVDGVVPDTNGHVARDVDRVVFAFAP